MKLMEDRKMHAKYHENLTLTINAPSAIPNLLTIKKIVSVFHESRTIRKVKY